MRHFEPSLYVGDVPDPLHGGESSPLSSSGSSQDASRESAVYQESQQHPEHPEVQLRAVIGFLSLSFGRQDPGPISCYHLRSDRLVAFGQTFSVSVLSNMAASNRVWLDADLAASNRVWLDADLQNATARRIVRFQRLVNASVERLLHFEVVQDDSEACEGHFNLRVHNGVRSGRTIHPIFLRNSDMHDSQERPLQRVIKKCAIKSFVSAPDDRKRNSVVADLAWRAQSCARLAFVRQTVLLAVRQV